MSITFEEALDLLLKEEGGWSNHPSDRGGATFNGVTQTTYDQWRAVKKLPKQSVRNAKADEIKELYNVMYWRAAGCDTLPSPVNYLVFDGAVNSGPSRSVQWLQAALGVSQDGKVGPQTRAACVERVSQGDASFLLKVVMNRSDFLADLVKSKESQEDFLKGWWRRTLRVLAVALTDDEEA